MLWGAAGLALLLLAGYTLFSVGYHSSESPAVGLDALGTGEAREGFVTVQGTQVYLTTMAFID